MGSIKRETLRTKNPHIMCTYVHICSVNIKSDIQNGSGTAYIYIYVYIFCIYIDINANIGTQKDLEPL